MKKLGLDQENQWLYIFIAFAVLINFTGIFVMLFGQDAPLYATISKEMVLRNNYLELFVEGKDWLDKPHFPFWITALFFKLFGFSTWAYKLPGILFVLLGAVYTYLFAKRLYNQQVALWSVLLLLTAQHIILSNNDLRAEPYLTGLIIASVFHFHKSLEKKWMIHVFIGSFFAACAIMTKGVFVLIPIGSAVAGELLIKKKWDMIFNIRWLLALLAISILIIPEIYSLYYQFDLHPEKLVFGQHQVSGIKFFLWDSQFGRFFNTGPIKGSGDPFFFLHTILWAFLPWSLLFYMALGNVIKKRFKNVAQYEWYCFFGILIPILVFSTSKFQLPHYLNIIFPFFAILTANYILSVTSLVWIKAMRVIQFVVIGVVIIMILTLHFFYKPEVFPWAAIIFILLSFILMVVISIKEKNKIAKVLFLSAAVIFAVNSYLNIVFYPSLNNYQAATQAALWINDNNNTNLRVIRDDATDLFSTDFYIKQPIYFINFKDAQSFPDRPYLFIGSSKSIQELKLKSIDFQMVKAFPNFRVTKLKPQFLNYNTRQQVLDSVYVVKIQ